MGPRGKGTARIYRKTKRCRWYATAFNRVRFMHRQEVVVVIHEKLVVSQPMARSRSLGLGGKARLALMCLLFPSISMFRPFVRQIRLARAFTTSRISYAQAQSQRQAPRALKVEDAPIVQYVKRRIEERQRLQSEVCARPGLSERGHKYPPQISEDALSDEDIQKVRKIRELEPLQDAWTEWNRAREVRHTHRIHQGVLPHRTLYSSHWMKRSLS